MSDTLKVVVFPVGRHPEVLDIPNTLEGMQAVVGGDLELVMWGDLEVYMNMDGIHLELPYNRHVGRHRVGGTFFISKSRRGEQVSLADVDIRRVLDGGL